MDRKELELYLHIPFCVRKCAYCDFLSFPAEETLRQKYVNALMQEMRGYKEQYAAYQVCTVFVGGGTPSILTPEQIRAVFHVLRESFHIDPEAEITIEVNPGTVTEEKLAAWKDAGINRISIGLQSVQDRELRMLGRIHDYRQFLDTWNQIRNAGIKNVNIDLISALPGQTLEGWTDTLEKTAELGPEHLSAYSLIIEEGTPFYERYGNKDREGKRSAAALHISGETLSETDFRFGELSVLPDLPDEETDCRIYEETEQILGRYGYSRYEISNYARKGYECRHNIGYWKRKEYLGIGLGASSLIRGIRFQNTSDFQRYFDCIQNRQSLCEEKEILSPQDERAEYMFLGLRMMCGVRKSEFFHLFGVKMEEIYAKPLQKMEKNGLLEIHGDVVRLTRRGIPVSNYVFSEFL